MATKIMIIRHAEKPSSDNSVAGIDANGAPNPEELIVRGWQRAGALVHLFASAGSNGSTSLQQPVAIFASGTGKHSNSLRPQHTVQAVAEMLGLTLDLSHKKGEEDALVAAVLAQPGPVLIAWEHEAVPGIANRIVGDETTCPQLWPGERFDLIWVFDQAAAGFRFTQVPQMLLPGDVSTPI